MGWEQRLLLDADLGPFFQDAGEVSFVTRMRAMMAQQKATWDMLSQAIEGLDTVETREFKVAGSRVTGQYNPGRIVSTSAKVDPASISSRPCFLCVENLPAEERGIRFDKDLVVLCNPFPVLKDHLVISATAHTPQLITGNFESLLDLAKSLGPDWFCLYNGPRCGASAPDHLHFQAAAAGEIPVFDDIDRWERCLESNRTGGNRFALLNYRLNLIVMQSRERDVLSEMFTGALRDLQSVTGEKEEPMINLIVRFEDGNWTIILYPRGKHRPACYFAEGDENLTVSPAAIDLSGLLVIPTRTHFERITNLDIAAIFQEISLDDERFHAWLSIAGRY